MEAGHVTLSPVCVQAGRRWCLSGTPIQNSVDDLYSYFRFLKYEPVDKAASFKELVKDKVAADPDHGYARLHALLQARLLFCSATMPARLLKTMTSC